MAFCIALCLLATLSAVAADLAYYIPQLTNSPIPGRVTASTLALDKPQCIFNPSSDNFVWLVVANSTVKLDDNALKNLVPYSSFTSLGYYHTFKTVEKNFSCSRPYSPNFIRVGDDTSCSDTQNCNGPLPSSGPYRVIFVILDTTGKLIDKTSWSGLISLRTGKSSSLIDTWPGRRSGGMIVITTILSVLLAAFLACLIGTFIVKSRGIGKLYSKSVENKENTVKTQEIDMKNYKTHHVQQELPIYDQPTETKSP